MPYAQTQAFVLDVAPLKEQDRLVQLLTADMGILKAVAPGSLKHKNRFGSLLELLTQGEFVYYWREEKELITLSRGEIINSYFNLISQPGNIFYFYLVSEVILKFVPHKHSDGRVYRLLSSILEQRGSGVAMDLLLLYFFVWIIRIEGMMFNPGICHNCFRKDIDRAWLRSDFRGLLCSHCRSDENLLLLAQDLAFLKWTENHSPGELNLWTKRIDSDRLIRFFKQKIEYHGEFILKSSQYLPQFK